jgi:hypothetical protein
VQTVLYEIPNDEVERVAIVNVAWKRRIELQFPFL